MKSEKPKVSTSLMLLDSSSTTSWAVVAESDFIFFTLPSVSITSSRIGSFFLTAYKHMIINKISLEQWLLCFELKKPLFLPDMVVESLDHYRYFSRVSVDKNRGFWISSKTSGRDKVFVRGQSIPGKEIKVPNPCWAILLTDCQLVVWRFGSKFHPSTVGEVFHGRW